MVFIKRLREQASAALQVAILSHNSCARACHSISKMLLWRITVVCQATDANVSNKACNLNIRMPASAAQPKFITL